MRRDWGFGVTAAEEATYTGAIYRLPASLATIRRLTASTAPKAVSTSDGLIRAHWKPRIRFEARPLPPGSYVFAVRIRASMNPHRTTLRVSKPFVVG